MYSPNSHTKIEIRIANQENLFDLLLCANEFIDFIDDFKDKFLHKNLLVLSAYYENILAGILIAEDQTQKIDSLEKIIPLMTLHLIFVNPTFRKKDIGKTLLKSFISTQKKNGIASIYVKLPQKYKEGIKFFLKNEFKMINKTKNKIVLEKVLWKDYGIRECHIIGENFNDMFY